MLNNGVLNGGNNLVSSESEYISTSSSFSQQKISKYIFESYFGNYYNFNDITYGKNYGNYIEETNIENLAENNIYTSSSPYLDGEKFNKKLFSEKTVEFSIVVTSDSVENLESEIENMKKFFNTGGKILKRESGKESYIHVELQAFEIGKILLAGTQIDINFISYDPLFKDINKGSKNFEQLNSPLLSTLVINDSQREPLLDVAIFFKEATENISEIELHLNGYRITTNNTVKQGDVLLFDGKKGIATLNGEEIEIMGELAPFPLLTPGEIKFLYNGEIQNYSMYILYDKQYL